MEFLELMKQGNIFVPDYSAKFEELSRYFPHYQNKDGERSKCIKFKGLCIEIKQEIKQFPVLMNRCMIYNEDNGARVIYYKNVGLTRRRSLEVKVAQNLILLYHLGKVKVINGTKMWQDGPPCEQVFRLGGHMLQLWVQGHKARNCAAPKKKQSNVVGSFHDPRPKTIERVFTLSGVEASEFENLIQGTCFINAYSLIVLFNSETTHSFISHDCMSV
ncbi:hypothetical protein CR513_28506, partial [Mucuna pruriens]